MINQKLTDYINQSRKTGMTDEQIRQALSASGWSEQDIQAAMSFEGGLALTKMRLAFLYTLIGVVGGATTAILTFYYSRGVLYLTVFYFLWGDSIWPSWSQNAITVIAVIMALAGFIFIFWLARKFGKIRLEKTQVTEPSDQTSDKKPETQFKQPLNPRHVYIVYTLIGVIIGYAISKLLTVGIEWLINFFDKTPNETITIGSSDFIVFISIVFMLIGGAMGYRKAKREESKNYFDTNTSPTSFVEFKQPSLQKEKVLAAIVLAILVIGVFVGYIVLRNQRLNDEKKLEVTNRPYEQEKEQRNQRIQELRRGLYRIAPGSFKGELRPDKAGFNLSFNLTGTQVGKYQIHIESRSARVYIFGRSEDKYLSEKTEPYNLFVPYDEIISNYISYYPDALANPEVNERGHIYISIEPYRSDEEKKFIHDVNYSKATDQFSWNTKDNGQNDYYINVHFRLNPTGSRYDVFQN